MAITIVEVKNCVYAREDKSLINCEAKLDGLPSSEFNNVWLGFTANPLDYEQHGKDIFANAEKGDYGSITAYSHPSLDIELGKIRYERNLLLAATDFYGMGDLTKIDYMTNYIKALSDITNGVDTAAKARAVTYPTKP